MRGPTTTTLALVFLKAPRAGAVKTRLARDVGEDTAAEIYRHLALRQVKAIPVGWAREIRFSPPDAADEMKQWLGAAHRYRAQCDGDLGARLAHAFAEAFHAGTSSVIAIGGDCPELDTADLLDAQCRLETHDVVLGPARDGGYYLIGLRALAPRLFEDIAWGTDRVFAATRARIAELELSCALLACKEDVDDLASWERYRARTRHAAGVARGAPAMSAKILP